MNIGTWSLSPKVDQLAKVRGYAWHMLDLCIMTFASASLKGIYVIYFYEKKFKGAVARVAMFVIYCETNINIQLLLIII